MIVETTYDSNNAQWVTDDDAEVIADAFKTGANVVIHVEWNDKNFFLQLSAYVPADDVGEETFLITQPVLGNISFNFPYIQSAFVDDNTGKLVLKHERDEV